MGEKSKISWTEATWNPFHGCKKVSQGCKYCYMFRDKERYGQDPTTVIKSKANFSAPLKWTEPKLIFTCSWSDWFIEEADEWRDELWKIIKNTPHHTYQILTKRPERIKDCLPEDWGEGYDNVWIGVSTENQKNLVERVEILHHVPAKTKFISCEPLLEKLDFDFVFWNSPMDMIKEGKIPEGKNMFDMINMDKSISMWDVIDWVILGGESGNENGKYKYRRSMVIWYKWLIEDCQKNNTPVFMKQLGTHIAKMARLKSRHGEDINEWHPSLQVQEFPHNYKN